jgi:hypothetical protein
MKDSFLFVVVMMSFGCNQPVQNPVSPEYPCGTRAHKCDSGGCCWNFEDCGGDVPSCPADMCCFADMGAAKDLDAGRKIEPQWGK